MARFLFVVPPLVGHINPTIGVGEELIERGHVVAWYGYKPILEGLLDRDLEIVTTESEIPESLIKQVEAQSKGLRGAHALKFFWEDFLSPLAHAMVPGVRRAVEKFKPDVIVADQQCVAGAHVALENGITWATSATTSAELVNPFKLFPKLKSWADDCLMSFQISHGVKKEDANADLLRESPHLVIAYTTLNLVGNEREFDEHFAFVGPSIGRRKPRDSKSSEIVFSDNGKKILISLGTVNGEVGERFYKVALDAMETIDAEALLVAPPDLIGNVPRNVIVKRFVSQLDILKHVDAVVTHGGHNTVVESLYYGLPLVVAPIRDDQPVISDQVVAAKVGVRVKFSRVQPKELKLAIESILHESIYRENAQRIRESFLKAGGKAEAANRLEKLA